MVFNDIVCGLNQETFCYSACFRLTFCFFLFAFHKEPKTDGRECFPEGADAADGAVQAASV